jgi:hypothetical protein
MRAVEIILRRGERGIKKNDGNEGGGRFNSDIL